MPAKTIYLDHNATTPLDPVVAEAMLDDREAYHQAVRDHNSLAWSACSAGTSRITGMWGPKSCSRVRW